MVSKQTRSLEDGKVLTDSMSRDVSINIVEKSLPHKHTLFSAVHTSAQHIFKLKIVEKHSF